MPERSRNQTNECGIENGRPRLNNNNAAAESPTAEIRNQANECGIENGGPRLDNTDAAVESPKAAIAVAAEDSIECIVIPVEDGGDPTSTMLWSP